MYQEPNPNGWYYGKYVFTEVYLGISSQTIIIMPFMFLSSLEGWEKLGT